MPAVFFEPPADPAITAARRRLEAEALATWRGWIDDVVAGGTMPDLRATFETGAILGIAQPLDALEADIAARREVEGLELQAERGRQEIAQSLAPYGGERGVQERLEELRAEVRRLEELANPWRYMACTSGAGRVHKLRRENPRAFPPEAPTAAQKSTKPKPRKS